MDCTLIVIVIISACLNRSRHAATGKGFLPEEADAKQEPAQILQLLSYY